MNVYDAANSGWAYRLIDGPFDWILPGQAVSLTTEALGSDNWEVLEPSVQITYAELKRAIQYGVFTDSTITESVNRVAKELGLPIPGDQK